LYVIHGAGSFGHVPADKYDLNSGLKKQKPPAGIAETHHAMEKLNYTVVSALIKAGLPAIAFQPSAGGILKDRRLISFPLDSARKMLQLGLIPVSYGDVLPDETLGASILSGDHLATCLAEKLEAEKVILVADVPGIYDRDPKNTKTQR